MHTLTRFADSLPEIPSAIAWYLSDISEFKGKQELYTRQSPQKLKVLREHALIESAVSSNRIEGVEIDRKRIGTVVFGKPLLKDRGEEEIQGYRDALEWIHAQGKKILINETTVKKLHRLSRGNVWDAGKYKEKDGDIIERLPSGDVRIRFKTVKAADTPFMIKKLIADYSDLIRHHKVHPLLAVTAFNLDFLCIHPFRDGNGRVSRLLLLLQLYHADIDVGRYISLERLIEEHKERYYETLQLSSIQWHKGRHDPWYYSQFLLYLIKKAYGEFSDRIEKNGRPEGTKTSIVLEQIHRIQSGFSLAQLQDKCPDVSYDMIRKILKKLKSEGKIFALGKGVRAQWYKKSDTLI
jgi:Fic family protein